MGLLGSASPKMLIPIRAAWYCAGSPSSEIRNWLKCKCLLYLPFRPRLPMAHPAPTFTLYRTPLFCPYPVLLRPTHQPDKVSANLPLCWHNGAKDSFPTLEVTIKYLTALLQYLWLGASLRTPKGQFASRSSWNLTKELQGCLWISGSLYLWVFCTFPSRCKNYIYKRCLYCYWRPCAHPWHYLYFTVEAFAGWVILNSPT